jgi:hypothetical protein
MTVGILDGYPVFSSTIPGLLEDSKLGEVETIVQIPL